MGSNTTEGTTVTHKLQARRVGRGQYRIECSCGVSREATSERHAQMEIAAHKMSAMHGRTVSVAEVARMVAS